MEQPPDQQTPPTEEMIRSRIDAYRQAADRATTGFVGYLCYFGRTAFNDPGPEETSEYPNLSTATQVAHNQQLYQDIAAEHEATLEEWQAHLDRINQPQPSPPIDPKPTPGTVPITNHNTNASRQLGDRTWVGQQISHTLWASGQSGSPGIQ